MLQKKILLIDHEPGVTRLVRRALEKAGNYIIREEHNDGEALRVARSFHPDLILVDSMKTNVESALITQQIQHDTVLKDTPLLCLSDLRPESQMVSGGILSGYSFFAAPIRLEECLRAIEHLLFGKD